MECCETKKKILNSSKAQLRVSIKTMVVHQYYIWPSTSDVVVNSRVEPAIEISVDKCTIFHFLHALFLDLWLTIGRKMQEGFFKAQEECIVSAVKVCYYFL